MGFEKMEIEIHCKYDELLDPNILQNHPDNNNKHSKEQVERLAKIIKYQGWRHAIKISKQSKCITSGHGRKAAAIFMGLTAVPVVYQDYKDTTQEFSDVQSDNSISQWAELDIAAISETLADLGPDYDIELLGIRNFELDPSEKKKKSKICPHCGKDIYASS